MGNYSFPENEVISEPAKDLIRSLLVLDPQKRLKLDEILNHDFFHICINIPKAMCPPSLNYIKQYIPSTGTNGIITNYVRKTKPPSESHTSDFDLGHGGIKFDKVDIFIPFHNFYNMSTK